MNSLQAALRWPLAVITLTLVSMVCSAFTAAKARDTRNEQVRFKAGQTGTSIKGKIVGYDSVAYVLGAEAGQTMTIALNPSNLATYFNVYEAGKKPGDQALANSGITGRGLGGVLSASNRDSIRFFKMAMVSRLTADPKGSPFDAALHPGIAVPAVNSFETPFGRVPVDVEALSVLADLDFVVTADGPHIPELFKSCRSSSAMLCRMTSRECWDVCGEVRKP